MLISILIGACVAFAAAASGMQINEGRWWVFVLSLLLAINLAAVAHG